MSILIDTDVLSAFAKINSLELFTQLFHSDEMIIPDGVFEELMTIKELGYEFVDDIFRFVKNTPLTESELDIYHSLLLYTSLGKGELQCIAVCISRNFPFITNDKKAKIFAIKKGIKAWDIPDILKALLKSGIKTKDDVLDLIDMLEKKDMMIFKNKDRILL